MKKNIFQMLGGGILVFVLSLSLTGVVSAAEPAFAFKTDWSYSGYLPNSLNNGVKAKSNIKVTSVSGGIYKVAITVRAENLPANTPGKDYAYQAWLVDSESNGRLSISATLRKNNGMGEMGSTQYMINPKIFDKLEITQEPLFDTNIAADNTIYSAGLDIPAFTELGYRTTLSPKNLVPPVSSSNKGGSGKFIINLKTNKIKYRLELKNIPTDSRKIYIQGPARAGANGPVVGSLSGGTGNIITGDWDYDDSIEAKLLSGEYYIQVHAGNNSDALVRGQIVF